MTDDKQATADNNPTESGTEQDRLQVLYPDDQPPHDADSKARDESQETAEKPQDPAAQPYHLTAPEGLQLDAELVTAATPVFRDIGLNDEQANKLLPLVPRIEERVIGALHDEFTATKTTWEKQARSDKEIGGSKWNESMSLAARALNAGGALPGSEVRKLLDDSGLGYHPTMIRLFRNIGQRLKAAGVGGTAIETRLNKLKVLYPDD